MLDPKAIYKQTLEEAGYQTSDRTDRQFYFEDNSVLGVVFVYENGPALLGSWADDQQGFLTANASKLRGAPNKAWNLYSVFLTPSEAQEAETHQIALIEEDFRATRKIAKANVATNHDATIALLPLLPLQNEVSLGVPDVEKDLKERLELSPAAWEALIDRKDPKLLARVLVKDS